MWTFSLLWTPFALAACTTHFSTQLACCLKWRLPRIIEGSNLHSYLRNSVMPWQVMWGSLFLKSSKSLGRSCDRYFGEPWEGKWEWSLPSCPLGRCSQEVRTFVLMWEMLAVWAGPHILWWGADEPGFWWVLLGFHQPFSVWPILEISGVANICWQRSV